MARRSDPSGPPGSVVTQAEEADVKEIIDMAKKAKALIVPYAITLSSFWEFNSWDKFRMPKPFSKILISYGDPIDVSDENKSFHYYQALVEDALKNQAEIV